VILNKSELRRYRWVGVVIAPSGSPGQGGSVTRSEQVMRLSTKGLLAAFARHYP
jgi:hypothetical protein